jgi:hypothetical protein
MNSSASDSRIASLHSLFPRRTIVVGARVT